MLIVPAPGMTGNGMRFPFRWLYDSHPQYFTGVIFESWTRNGKETVKFCPLLRLEQTRTGSGGASPVVHHFSTLPRHAR